jgi:hypothetical protein
VISRAEKMQAVYDQIPGIADCQGTCWISCGAADMTPWERKRLTDAGHELTRQELALRSPWDFWCEALGPDGRCQAYAIRPLICRLWGTVDWLPCPAGCRPVGGWLPNETAFRLIAEANALGGFRQPVAPEVFEALRDPAQVAALAKQFKARFNHDMVRYREYGGQLPAEITRRGRTS